MSLTNTFEEKKEEFNKELDQLFPNSDLTITYTRKTSQEPMTKVTGLCLTSSGFTNE